MSGKGKERLRMESREERKRYRTPAVEICETPQSVTLLAEMPGVEKDDFDISIDEGGLAIRGKRRPLDSGLNLIHCESDQGDYSRSFSLGDELDTSNVVANAENGILTLTFHKKPEVLPKKIPVEVG
jgi:HSP20 family molecular chaperone IbpA